MYIKGKLSTYAISIIMVIFLSACGGGGGATSESTDTTNNSINIPLVNSNVPQRLASDDWESAQILLPSNKTHLSLEVIGSEMIIDLQTDDLRLGNHVQIYLDTDNESHTGFQFEGEAWAQSGIDYLIEDGWLYKSTSSNTNWDWNSDAGQIHYAVSIDSIKIKIDLSLLGDICNTLNVGLMTRDHDWNIATFYPASTTMKKFTLSYCNSDNDSEPPVISLNGANPLTLSVNAVFNDPGATATDNVDGNISGNIVTTSNVNTSIAGNYTVEYQVSDNAGNTTSTKRDVIVSATTQDGIVIDGNSDDWSEIPIFSSSSNGTMKVADDAENLYILVTSSNLGANTQLFIDTDDSSGTGLDLEGHISQWLAGADYMVENNSLDKSTSNSSQWAWDYGIAPIDYARTTEVLEIAIKKSDLGCLCNSIPMGFISRDQDWNVNYILPSQQLSSYTINVTEPDPDSIVNANDDSASTTNDQSITIDVLANDTSSENNPLTIDDITQPQNGSISINQNKIIYSPNPGFTGTDTFTYQVSDGGSESDTGNVSVVVTDPVAGNNPPIAANDPVSTIGTQPVTISVLDNDSDPDNDTLTVTGITSQASNGTVTSISNDQFSYTANAGFTGTDSFIYAISDGNGGTDTAQVTIIVTSPPPPAPNNSPDAVEDVADVDFDKTVTVNVLANDTDPDGDTLTVQSIVQPPVGSAVLNTNGTIFFNPQNNVGSISIGYTVSDGRGGTDFAILTVSSTDPNDGNDAFPDITNENVSTPVNTPIFIDVLANDTDADGDVLILDQVDQGANGTTVKINGGVQYTPNPGFTGTDTFFYGVHDGHGHNGAGMVTVTVTP